MSHRSRAKTGASIALFAGCAHAPVADGVPDGVPDGGPRYVAHRGVHATFSAAGVDATTCTARRIDPPRHGFLENTLPSVSAAFDAGADAVEVDVHATRDGQLVLFHDASLACRTDGTGPPEAHTLEALRALDLGYGYTADDGATYPLRGTGVGLATSLAELYAAFPDGAFVIDVKAGGADVGDLVADTLASLPPAVRARQWAYGSPAAVDQLEARLPEVHTFTRRGVVRCLTANLAVGWLGIVPNPCRDTVVLLPVDRTGLAWGGAPGFDARLRRHGSELVLIGPMGDVTTGIDDPATAARVPAGFSGWVWTNRIEVIGPRPWDVR